MARKLFLTTSTLIARNPLMVPLGNVVTLLNIKTCIRMLMKPALWIGAIGFGSSHKKASTAILALYQSPKRSVITHEFFPLYPHQVHPKGAGI